MWPKDCRKTQPQAGGPKDPSPEAQAQGSSSEMQSQLQAGSPWSPASPQTQASPSWGQPQPQEEGASENEFENESRPQPGPSWVYPLGTSERLFSPEPSTSPSKSREAQLEAGAPAPQSPGQAKEVAAEEAEEEVKEAAEAEAGAPRFRVGDQVLSLHGSLLYQAKCLRVAEAACGTAAEAQAGSLTYLIHYTGWNKNWDEWVPASRVFECSEANLRRQSELLAMHQARLPPSKKGRGGMRARKPPALQQRGEGRPGSAPQALGAGEGAGTGQGAQPSRAPRRKRVRPEEAPEVPETPRDPDNVRVEIPELLKPWLVDEWDRVTQQKQLCALPARKTVDAILEDYEAVRSAQKPEPEPAEAQEQAFAMMEVVAGIKEYFNVMLGSQLLYKYERPQYEELLAAHPYAPLSGLYGAPHLLRLFVRIGTMLACTPLDDRSLALLLSHLQDFVGYLADNRAVLFCASDYSAPPPEYYRQFDSDEEAE